MTPLFWILLGLGLFALVSKIAPTGGDNFEDLPVLDPTDPRQLERFERLVSEVATGILQRLREGIRVGLVVGSIVVPPVRSVRRAPMLLRPLAEVEPVSTAEEGPIAVDSGRTMLFKAWGAGR